MLFESIIIIILLDEGLNKQKLQFRRTEKYVRKF